MICHHIQPPNCPTTRPTSILFSCPVPKRRPGPAAFFDERAVPSSKIVEKRVASFGDLVYMIHFHTSHKRKMDPPKATVLQQDVSKSHFLCPKLLREDVFFCLRMNPWSMVPGVRASGLYIGLLLADGSGRQDGAKHVQNG